MSDERVNHVYFGKGVRREGDPDSDVNTVAWVAEKGGGQIRIKRDGWMEKEKDGGGM